MRSITVDDGAVCTSPDVPRAARPVFVAGMGRRMATAALCSRSATSREGIMPGRAGVQPSRTIDAAPGRLASPRPAAAGSWDPKLASACWAATLCTAAAFGAALLYWQKSSGGAESREIARVVQAAQQAHARTSLLRTEWAELNEPGHLQDLADRTLALRPIAPGQFVEPGQLHSWFQSPVSVPPAESVEEPRQRELPVAPPGAVPLKPAFRSPRVVVAALPLPPPVPLHPSPAVLPASFPAPHLAHAATPARFELPRWLTQTRLRSAAVPVMSEPPHDLVMPAASHPVVAPADPWPVSSRTFAAAATPPGEPPYDNRVAGWDARGWPYAYAAPYGWRPPY